MPPIESSVAATIGLIFIVTTEALAASFALFGAWRMGFNRHGAEAAFADAKRCAIIGAGLAVLNRFLGFFVIGGSLIMMGQAEGMDGAVEAIQFPGQTDESHRLVGFAIEPADLERALLELKRRGIALGKTRSVNVPDSSGATKTLWTNVTLLQFSDADDPANARSHIFLSEYDPSYLDVEGRRSRLRKELVDAGGGPLAVTAVKEVVIGTADLDAARRLWQKLLDPLPPVSSDTWRIGDGPSVRLVAASENTVQTLVVQVTSLEKAKRFLEETQLLGAESSGRLTIDPSKVDGLDIVLVSE